VTAPGVPARAFLDEKKQVAPGVEWKREVGSPSGGTISFRVESQGPFVVTVIKGEAYKSLTSGNRRLPGPSDVLLTANSQAQAYDGTVTIPAGTVYFIIANRNDKEVEFHLECFHS
jgi:hypothetical protein